jgi:hypothetical protein
MAVLYQAPPVVCSHLHALRDEKANDLQHGDSSIVPRHHIKRPAGQANVRRNY